jgi:hypothetical protein
VKIFLVVKERWWEEDNRANRYATRLPTRELHYWKGLTQGSKQGPIMVYTDAPASTFWANYIPPGPQMDAHRSTGKRLPAFLETRLTRKCAQYISAEDFSDFTPEDIVWYGIRDWSREPYGGAAHAWRPERKYWVVMRRLAEIRDSGNAALHICGEAYSDYHGFMEGSLRSATYVLHRILDGNAETGSPLLPWLRADGADASAAVLTVNPKYLEQLRLWVSKLDSVSAGEEFLYQG